MSEAQTASLQKARALAEQERFVQARALYTDILAHDPQNIDGNIELGVLEARCGDFQAAEQHLAYALRLAPDDPVVHLNLAELQREAGDLESAAGYYKTCLTHSPDDADALYGLGDALRLLGRCEEALGPLEHAARLVPDDPEILNALGIVYDTQGRTKRAIATYKQAIALDTSNAESWINYGVLLSREGLYEQSCRIFETASGHVALDGQTLVNWARDAMHLGHDRVAMDLAEKAAKTGAARAEVELCKGSVHEHFGRFDAARLCYEAVVAAAPGSGHGYRHLSRINLLSPATTNRLDGILSDPSGTPASRAAAGFALYALLDKAADYDRAFTALSEANALERMHAPFDRERHAAALNDVAGFFSRERFSAMAGWGDPDATPIFIVGLPRSGTTLTEQILAFFDTVSVGGERTDIQRLALTLKQYPQDLGALRRQWFAGHGKRIFEEMLGPGSGSSMATDKLPGNYVHCGLIALLFPHARIVHCRRDPRDLGLSLYAQDFRARMNFAASLEDIAFVYREYERLMRHWEDTLPVQIHTVHYENLVQDTVPTARSLVEYCGLEWNDACIATHEVDRPIHTASVWQVRQPINAGSVGKWQRYERHLAPFTRALERE